MADKCIRKTIIILLLVSPILTHCSKDTDIIQNLPTMTAVITVVSGDNQTGFGGERLAEPIVIRVTNSIQSPIDDVDVLLRILKGGGSVNSLKVQTDNKGLAEAFWTIGYGDNELEVSIVDNRYEAQPCTLSAAGECICEVPAQIGDGWETVSIEDVGLNLAKICGVLYEIYGHEYEFLLSLLIVKDGKLVFEQYPNSYRMKLQPIASVTKSVTSALIGIAIDEGFITGINESLFDFFPEYAHLRNEAKDRILLRHVLSMTSGFECNEFDVPYSDPRNDVNIGISSGNYIQFVLSKPVVDEPGTKWYYNSGNSILLGGIIKNTTGIHADAYALSRLFNPLGITAYQWYYQTDGLPYTHGGLLLRSRDMAKFGYLYLQRGSWNGEQIVPEEWVNESTVSQVTDGQYGYQWWVGAIYGYDFYIAVGYGGQRIINIPGLEMIIVHTSDLVTIDDDELPERLDRLNSIVKEIIKAAIE